MPDFKNLMNHVPKPVKDHPLASLAIIGLCVNILATMMAAGYDSMFWATVVRNVRIDAGLYEMHGYFYTPIWGYFLGAVDAVSGMVMNLGELGVVVPEALGLGTRNGFFFTPIATDPAFNLAVRVPLIIGDLVLAWMVYDLVLVMNGSKAQAYVGFAATILCPLLIASSCINGMPDVFSAIFALGTVLMLMRQNYLLSGIFFSVAVLTKFFPVFLFFILCAYILARHKDDIRTGFKHLLESAIGAASMTLVLYIPLIMEGTVMDSFRFILDRADTIGSFIGDRLAIIIAIAVSIAIVMIVVMRFRQKNGRNIINCRNLLIIGIVMAVGVITAFLYTGGIDNLLSSTRVSFYALLVILSLILSVSFYRYSEPDIDKKLIAYSFLMMTACVLYPPAPQYIVVAVPFLAFMVAIEGKGPRRAWVLLAIATFAFVPIVDGPILMSIAEWTDLMSVDTVMGLHNCLDTEIWGTDLRSLLYLLTGILQYLAILSILWYGSVKNKMYNVMSDVKRTVLNERA